MTIFDIFRYEFTIGFIKHKNPKIIYNVSMGRAYDEILNIVGKKKQNRQLKV